VTEWISENYIPSMVAIVVLVITVNLWGFRVILRRMLSAGHQTQEIVAVIVVGHAVTYFVNLLFAVAFNVARWAPMTWTLSIREALIWCYTFAVMLSLLEALTVMAWQQHRYALPRTLNRAIMFFVGVPSPTTQEQKSKEE